MTVKEINEALFTECSVELEFRDGCTMFHIPCDCISAIIFRKGENCRTDVSVELRDKNGRGHLIADPAKVRCI